MSAHLLSELIRIVGAAHVLTHEDPATDLSAWEQDWRRRSRGKALAVVRPASTAEVAAVVKACVAAGTPLVPQGGNTGLAVGSIPDDSGRQVVLSLTRMNAVRQIDPHNLTFTVEAGCILQNLQTAAEQAGYLFPLSLAAEGSCTIGGNLGTNAGGTQVLRYGNTREPCLGLEVVTAQGEVWDGLSGLRKDNTGYDPPDRLGRRALAGGGREPAGPGTPATGRRAHRLRGDGPVRAQPGGQAHAPAARVLSGPGRRALGRVAGELRQRVGGPRPGTLREAAGAGPGARHRARCRGGRKPQPGPPAVACAREHSAGPGRGRLEHQARHQHPGAAHPGLLRRDRCPAAARDPRRAPGQLRPPGRRQPALQRAGPGRWRPQSVSA